MRNYEWRKYFLTSSDQTVGASTSLFLVTENFGLVPQKKVIAFSDGIRNNWHQLRIFIFLAVPRKNAFFTTKPVKD